MPRRGHWMWISPELAEVGRASQSSPAATHSAKVSAQAKSECLASIRGVARFRFRHGDELSGGSRIAVRCGCCGSIHRRRSSIDEASSFFEKVQLHFQLADLLVEFVLLGVGLLAHLLAAVAEDVWQAGQRLFLPPSDLGRVDAEHLRDLGGRLVRQDCPLRGSPESLGMEGMNQTAPTEVIGCILDGGEDAKMETLVYITDSLSVSAVNGWRPRRDGAQTLTDIFEWMRVEERALEPLFCGTNSR
jgi:hypothetical protein